MYLNMFKATINTLLNTLFIAEGLNVYKNQMEYLPQAL